MRTARFAPLLLCGITSCSGSAFSTGETEPLDQRAMDAASMGGEGPQQVQPHPEPSGEPEGEGPVPLPGPEPGASASDEPSDGPPEPALRVTFDDDFATGFVHDLAPPNDDGTVLGDLQFVPGHLGAGVTNFASGARVDFGDVFDPDENGLTVAVWFKTPNLSTAQVLLSKGSRVSSDPGWVIAVEDDSVFVRARTSSGATGVGQTCGGLVSDTWHHIAMVYDPASFSISAYLDGDSAPCEAGGGGTTSDTLTELSDMDVSAPLLLGVRSDLGARFAGTLDELSVWRVALSSEQVWATYGSQ